MTVRGWVVWSRGWPLTPTLSPEGRGGRSRLAADYAELLHAPVIRLGHVELEIADGDVFAHFRQVAEFGGGHAADGVEFFVGEGGAYFFVEVGDGR